MDWEPVAAGGARPLPARFGTVIGTWAHLVDVIVAGHTLGRWIGTLRGTPVLQPWAFGQEIGRFQNSRFQLAEMATEIEIAQTYVDRAVLELNAGTLSPVDAAKAKWWTTELMKRTADRCLQLHGGYGYMDEYPISRFWRDARIHTIFGGTTEIMKEIIGRDLGF